MINSFIDQNSENIKLIDKENGGHGSTINVSIPKATGKYIRILDGDDWVDEIGFNKFIQKLLQEDCDIVLTDYSEYHSTLNTMVAKNWYNNLLPYEIYNIDDLCHEGYGFSVWEPILATATFKTCIL